MADNRTGFQDAPLLALIAEGNLTERLQPESPESSDTEQQSIGDVVHLPQGLMLQDEDLVTLLAATEQFWPIWPPWQYGTLPPTMRTLQTGGVIFAACFLSQMARSSSHCIAAKALLWLSLCVQQAPMTLQLTRCLLLQEALLASYMRTAESLLASASGKGETLHGIEARLIQQKLYMNMGRPRRAWLSLRRAADEAMLLRLHRSPEQINGGGGGGERHREVAIWTEIWHLETNFALILGLPNTVPGFTSSTSYESPLCMFQHRLGGLAASVVARNQSAQPSYFATVELGHELEQCRGLMPDIWWNELPQLDQSFVQVFARQATKIQYFLIVKLLHLPFMLSANDGHKYSRTSAAAASRGLIAAYLGLRSCDEGQFTVCESLEFQAFSAGVTLLIRLISNASLRAGSEDVNVRDDWALIEALTTALRRTANLMRCRVASQAAEVLGLLTQAAQCTYTGPDRYNVVLPYFGKITITRSRSQSMTHPNGRGEYYQQQQQQQPPQPPPPPPPSSSIVSISANLSNFGHFPGSPEGELGGDWTSMAGIDMNFDWMQTFTFESDNIDNDNNDSNINDLL
ncbi:hypothetical protein LTR78_009815 [Recurvomyces mirabilis]|uniref:Transcription factor domain-containing protein n=1 Tax=Recurvomyces mirabilis TaxID=574656 RepID=A0AAE0TT55_9PEZI|nr:hypothetical protein LTR78_009815 [Recurvomyces mirabilis]KAK5153051.1 hypothetical protein LTS14_007695 [Recurvomyces mirabilis]